MSKKLLVSSSVFFLTFLSSAHATNTSSRGLLDIYQLALSNDATYAAERFDADALHASGSLYNSQLLPDVRLSANYAYNRNQVDYAPGSSLSDFERDFKSRGATLQLRQPVLRVDRYFGYRRDAINQQLSELNLKLAEQNLILRIASIYFENLRETENLSVAVARKNAFLRSLDKANLSFQLGTNTITDKLEAQARFDLASSDEIEARSRLSSARENMRLITGSVYTPFPLREDNVLPKLDNDNINGWKTKSESNNADLRKSMLSLQQASQHVNAVRSEFLPQLELVGALSYYEGLSFGSDQTRNEASATLQFEMPIFSGGATSSKLRQAVAQRERQRFLQEQMARDVEIRTQTTYLSVIDGYARLDALSQAVKSSQSAMEATQKGLEVGIRTNLDLLNAQQQYFETKRDYINQRFKYLYALLELKAIAGELDLEDLKKLDRLFGPADT
ncbi:MAG: TolC family outer membrane protein [Gammaproteobacteria bacterium]|nr:TolC family outer membrane protein [Gammaproteobacteria bacterium]